MKSFDAVRKDFPEGGTPGGMNRCVNWRRGKSRGGERNVFVGGGGGGELWLQTLGARSLVCWRVEKASRIAGVWGL